MRFLTILVILCTIQYHTQAQKLTKEEEKQLKAELKELSKNPEKFKKAKQENDYLNQKYTQQRKDVDFKQNEIVVLAKQKEDKILKEHAIETEISFNKNESENKKNYANSNRTENIVYRVQIGNYRNPEIQNFLEKNPDSNNFVVEDAVGGKRYILGEFTTQEEARSLSSLFIAKGGQSFVIAYRNGKRLNNLKELKNK